MSNNGDGGQMNNNNENNDNNNNNTVLGVQEFSAALNGDNPSEILRVLKLFSKTVARERNISLGTSTCSTSTIKRNGKTCEDDDNNNGNQPNDDSSSEEEEDDDDDDDNEGLDAPPRKKVKKSEGWKEDTNAYHVPFVGTSVARGERIRVESGVWPTGLLGAYLKNSPYAVELINDDIFPLVGQLHKSLQRRKRGRLSRSIQKYFLKALAELITAAVPVEKLAGENSITDNKYRSSDNHGFLQGFLKTKLIHVINLLNEETDRGRGKQLVAGGCASLAAPALLVLQRVSMISVSHARQIARSLEEGLSDGVIKVLLRPGTRRRSNSESVNDQTKKSSKGKPARNAAISLAGTLVEAGDAAVNTYISTGGSRERKIKPGILYIALREGLNLSPQQPQPGYDNAYCTAVSDLMRSVRSKLLSTPTGLDRQLRKELLSNVSLHNLCNCISHAPTLTKEQPIEEVLYGTDTYEDSNDLQRMGIEARRLLFPLISDSKLSPFFVGSRISKSDENMLVRILLRLLQLPNGGIQIRHFIFYCIEKMPSLLSALHRSMTFPDIKNTFEFVSTLNFVTTLLHNGPSPMTCLKQHENGTVDTTDTESTMSVLLPVKLKRSVMVRILQSQNPFIIQECFKFILVALQRFHVFRLELEQEETSTDYVRSVSSTFVEWIPSVQQLLAIRQRIDSNKNNSQQHQQQQRSNIFVADSFYRVVQVFAQVLPGAITSTKYDWMKLLVDTEKSTHVAQHIQILALKCLKSILTTCRNSNVNFVTSFEILLKLMLSTRSQAVYSMSREIAIDILSHFLWMPRNCLRSPTVAFYECSFWIDALTSQCLPLFCKFLHQVSSKDLDLVTAAGEALFETTMPHGMEFSSAWVAALTMAKESDVFATYASQVATRCLLMHKNPIPFAVLIKAFGTSASSEEGLSSDTQNECLTRLVTYAEDLVDFEADDQTGRFEDLWNLISTCFSGEDFWLKLMEEAKKCFNETPEFSVLKIVSESLDEEIILCRFLNHLQHTLPQTEPFCLQMLLSIAPSMFMGLEQRHGEAGASSINPNDFWFLANIAEAKSSKTLDTLILSCPFAMEIFRRKSEEAISGLLIATQDGQVNVLTADGKEEFLRLTAFRSHLSPSSTAALILCAVQLCMADKQADSLATPSFVVSMIKSSEGVGPDVADNNLVLDHAMRTWWMMTSADMLRGDLDAFHEIVSYLCKLLIAALKGKEIAASRVISFFFKRGKIEHFVDNCFLYLSDRVSTGTESTRVVAELMEAVVHRDPCHFGPAIIRKFGEAPKPFLKVWESGMFDKVLRAILERWEEVPYDAANAQSLAGSVMSRASASFGLVNVGRKEWNEVIPQLDLLFATLRSLRLQCAQREKTASGFLQLVLTTPQSLPINTDVVVQELCIHLMYGENSTPAYITVKDRQILVPKLFENLCTRAVAKKNDTDHNPVDSKTILDLLMTVIARSQEDDWERCVGLNPKLLQRVFRRCLRDGITAEDVGSGAAVSLRLLQALMKGLSDPLHPMYKLSAMALIPPPTTVFEMIVSHSQFERTLSASAKGGKSSSSFDCDTGIELVRLMKCCIFLSKNIVITKPVWNVIFKIFNISLSSLDTELRLFFLMCRSKGVKLPTLDEFRWRSSPVLGVDKSGSGRWEWLINSLDAGRIKATISNFPLSDDLNLSATGNGGNVLEDGDGSLLVSCDKNEEQQVFSAAGGSYEGDISTCDGAASGEDIRYSPAFLLPLILGALDNEVPDIIRRGDGDLGSNLDQLAGTKEVLSFLSMARRLCDKGIIGLCMASLASRSKDVRDYAVSIIGLVLLACTLPDAHKITTWRDRPQVLLLLKSVHRALVLKVATTMDSAGHLVKEIPILPSLSAIFLARASFTLSRPEDPLYGPINRYFLKCEQDAGAFQDLTRLPGFISLFCSSSDDPVQSRKERVWALQMLRDGFLDAADYRSVTACHAPEILLTSFENARLLKMSNELVSSELCLMLDVFKKLIDYGGQKAAYHLVGRMGLLSWMRSYSCSRCREKFFPTTNVKFAYYSLLDSILRSSLRHPSSRPESLYREVIYLIEPVIDVFLDAGAINGKPSQLLQPKKDEVTPSRALCQTLAGMARVVLNCNHEISLLDEESYGVPIGKCLSLLDRLPIDLQGETIWSLCVLPFGVNRSSSVEGRAFCDRAIEWCPSVSVKQRGSLEHILRRVLHVLKEFCETMRVDEVQMNLFLACGSVAVTSPECYSLWSKCLSTLLPNCPECDGKSTAEGFISTSM